MQFIKYHKHGFRVIISTASSYHTFSFIDKNCRLILDETFKLFACSEKKMQLFTKRYFYQNQSVGLGRILEQNFGVSSLNPL